MTSSGMNLANRLTLVRIILVPAFVGALLYYSSDRKFLQPFAAFLFALACLTDAMDGYWARKMNEATTLGSYIDPIADKLLLLSGFLSLSFMTNLPESMRIPAWVTIPVLSRDAIILIGSTMIFITTGTLKASPLWVGKLTTFFQMATLFAALIMSPQSLQWSLYGITVFLTVLSGFYYVRMGGRILQTN